MINLPSWSWVGAEDGEKVGELDGKVEGKREWADVGLNVLGWSVVGSMVGRSECLIEGWVVIMKVGMLDNIIEGASDGVFVGAFVGALQLDSEV